VPYSAKILADSVGAHGVRLTTFELCYPRMIHSEFMTHRMISRNAASSRAIPVEKMIKRVEEDPVEPLFWGANQKGMQAHQALTGLSLSLAQGYWEDAQYQAVSFARRLADVGAHKQIVNRILEPFSWITVIASATEWGNFINLRPRATPSTRPSRRSPRSSGWRLRYVVCCGITNPAWSRKMIGTFRL
jgi:hypothetical protein